MRRTVAWLGGGLILAAGAALVPAMVGKHHSMQWPAPTDGGPGESNPDFIRQRQAWIESLHRHEPGLDWRAQDAQWRSRRMRNVQAERAAALAAGADTEQLRQVDLSAISGTWRERGSGNQAGRITGAIYDAASNQLTALSDGGNIWHADRGTLNWTSANDSATFRSSGFLDSLDGTSDRLLVASDAPMGVYYSDNAGLSFSAASGTGLPNPWYTMGMAVREAAGNDVYLTRVHWDSTASSWRAQLFASTDRAASFVPLGFVGERDRVALFSPRYDSSEMYLLVDGTLDRIVAGTQALETIGTVPVSPPVAPGDRVVLSGGVDTGQAFLYAFYSRASVSRTDVYRSLDGGQTWQARNAMPENLFGAESAETSTRDPSLVYAGGVNVYRSVNGASSWAIVNNWGEYYADPATKLHADIPDIDVWLDDANAERVLISTDGGLYESSDNLATVHNLSLQGLRVSQYYASQTGGDGSVFAGAQDQGYQKSIQSPGAPAAPSGGIDDFVQTISGDYGHLDSTDDGASLWMDYPGFAMLDTATSSTGQGGLHMWNFPDNAFGGALWMPPIIADPSAPHAALLAGGTLSGGGNHVVRLAWSGSSFTAVQDSFDFGSVVTALAFSSQDPGERYALTSARHFFRDSGSGWVDTASNLPANHYFYGNVIVSDPVRPDTIYVAGAGYSNPAVFVSTNDGTSFAAMASGLPNTMVFGLAISPDGQHLFAATEVGPFYFDRSLGGWVDISGLGGPDQIYWDVDYIESGGSGIARFATYGRGIWDFVVSEDGIFSNGFEAVP